MDLRSRGIGVHRLESNPEPADFREIVSLLAFTYPTHTSDIIVSEASTVVCYFKFIRINDEAYFGCAGIFSVLQEFEDEVCPVWIEITEIGKMALAPTVFLDIIPE